jgi:hypothetical protein
MKKQTVAAFLDISDIVWCDAQKGAISGNRPIYVEPAVM